MLVSIVLFFFLGLAFYLLIDRAVHLMCFGHVARAVRYNVFFFLVLFLKGQDLLQLFTFFDFLMFGYFFLIFFWFCFHVHSLDLPLRFVRCVSFADLTSRVSE